MSSPLKIKSFLDWLNTPVQFIKGVGPYYSKLLTKLNINSLEDLVYHLPFRYLDRRHISDIHKLRVGENACVLGEVFSAGEIYLGRRKHRVFEVILWDGKSYLVAKWFHYPRQFFVKKFRKGDKFLFFGEVTLYRSEKQMVHPEIQSLEDFFTEDEIQQHLGIFSVYPSTEGFSQKQWRKIIAAILKDLPAYWLETLPELVHQNSKWIHARDALLRLHHPQESDMNDLSNLENSIFRRSLAFEELFYLQLGIGLLKRQSKTIQGISHRPLFALQEQLLSTLPFELTEGQKRAIEEITQDMISVKPMNRLLQGDVGSGKTLVAIMVSLLAVANGNQVILMVPTEILAEQHFFNFSKYLSRLGVVVHLLTASTKEAERRKILEAAEQGAAGIFIGTHALLEADFKLAKLSLIIIDEQHRFGVRQRLSLIRKGEIPDVLVMTATPIPRSLAMTVYGDLDLSLMPEMPIGRQPILTKLMKESDRPKLYDFIRKKLKEGRQCYFIFPLIEESEKSDLKNAKDALQRLQSEFFGYEVALLHGRMKTAEKEAVMRRFSEGEIHILIATTVVEVGVDVPNATLMIIEHAERFGLSQLHQLRGRVGRGTHRSYCILATGLRRSEVALERLRVMTSYQDGFQISEEDLKIRGPGDFLGVRQSGIPDFRVASLIHDGELLEYAKRAANSVLAEDPELSQERHQILREVLLHRWRGRLSLAQAG